MSEFRDFGYSNPEADQVLLRRFQASDGLYPDTLEPAVILHLKDEDDPDPSAGVQYVLPPEWADHMADQLRNAAARARAKGLPSPGDT